MTGVLGTLQLAALAALGFALAVTLLSAAAGPTVLRVVARWAPARRARALFVWAAAPVLSAVLLTALCFLPSALAAIGLLSDHCPTHDHHVHLCLLHPAETAGSAFGWLLLAAALAWPAVQAARQVRALLRARQLLRDLHGASRPAGAGLRTVGSDRPFSFVAGLLRQRIYVSAGLTGRVSEDVLSVVLEHERAHVRRRDGARKLVARFVSTAHLPAVRAHLLAELDLACEQACDEEAALVAGDRLRVAEAILVVERTLAGLPAGFGVATSSFGGSNVVARVEALLDAPACPRAKVRGAWIGLALALSTAAAGWLHHVTETLLGLLPG